MKKVIVLLSLISFFSIGYSWAYPTIPSTYYRYMKNDAISIYKSRSEDIYAIVVTTADADISFGGNLGSGNEIDTYYKGTITEHFDENSNSDTVAVINGQFFDVMGTFLKYKTTDPAKLVYPVKSNYTKLSSTIYDTNYTLRSLLINSSGQVYIREGFSQVLFNSSAIKEYIVGLYPSAVKNPDSAIGRHYIGGITKDACNPSTTICEYEYLIFFIAKSSTHYNMLSQMSLWGIPAKSRIMMDGSGSAQMYIDKTTPLILKGDGRYIPNSIIIGN